jgi:hypothetical protein
VEFHPSLGRAIRRVVKRLILAAAFSLWAMTAHAQAPVTSLSYRYAQETALNVGLYTQVITIDGNVVTTPPTCTQAAADVVCTVPVGTLAAGPHTLRVDATKDNITATTIISNLNIGSVSPKNPTGFKYNITLTVALP